MSNFNCANCGSFTNKIYGIDHVKFACPECHTLIEPVTKEIQAKLEKLYDEEKVNRNKRISKDDYYFEIAKAVLLRGTCRRRNYGSVIVKNDMIISTGYTGAPRGKDNCIDGEDCYRQINNIPPGQQYEKCRSVHSEQNAIINASRESMIGATIYIVGKDMSTGKFIAGIPCDICERMIINSGITEIKSYVPEESE